MEVANHSQQALTVTKSPQDLLVINESHETITPKNIHDLSSIQSNLNL